MFKKETGPSDRVKGEYRRRGLLLFVGALFSIYLSVEFLFRLVVQNDRSAVGLVFSFAYFILGVIMTSKAVKNNVEYKQATTLERV